MKTALLFLLTISVCLGLRGQSVITIGSGSDSQGYPFALFGGYARSAAIYSSGEIGISKFITSLGWQVASGDIELCPVKIYLKLTSDATLSPATWSSLTSGATLVCDAAVSFPIAGWKTIDIADFVYLSGQNLLVLCEANYGGNGAPSNPVFAYSYNSNKHEKWQHYETPPTGSGSVDNNRPNIQITWFELSDPNQPSGLMAQAASTSEINLLWKKNANNNDVMVAFNTVNTFGIPSGNYVAGNTITGGGAVLYNGSATSFSHNTGLNPATTYYYRAWSLTATPTYSTGAAASATTLCGALGNFPNTTDFESPTFPPVCWSLAQKPWMRDGTVSAFGIGTGSAYSNFYNEFIPAGTSFDLISPTLNLTSLSNPVVSFDHAYATYAGEVDRLELWVSSNNGLSYSLLNTWLGGTDGDLNTGGAITDPFIPTAGQWASKSYAISAVTNKILLRGVSAFGNNLYLDNITIGEPMVVWNGSVSAQWNNPLNWTPAAVPLLTENVSIPSGKPNNPVIATEGNACKNLVIQTGASITVSPVGSNLTIWGDVTIQNGAIMTNNGSVTIKGNLTNLNSN
ncbi:MAG: hypothetical protein WCP32_06450 [Bacteroidota bacterium]